jgi:tyrosyl-tRNA synthetase
MSEHTTPVSPTHPLLEELAWRGLIFDQTEGLHELLSGEVTSAYIGFDPTADSLHVGNLLAIMGLVHLQRHGHRPIALVGGATGMVGDPSGKSKERNLLDNEQLNHNVSCIREQLARFLDFNAERNPAKLVNNADWLGGMGFIEFMRDVGKHFPLGYMLGKESVKRRLEGAGISFTEFSYMMLQAYDFAHLFEHEGCTLQMGGSDQWGNVTAGIELIRRMNGGKGHGLVFPLVTSSTGEKFGKTVDGAVWLDAQKTSPYQFYQFWLNTPDVDVDRYLKCFTLMDREELEALMSEHAEAPHARKAQRALAQDVTRRVHGDEALERVERAASVMFGGSSVLELSAREVEEVFAEVPSTVISAEEREEALGSVGELLVRCGVCKSKGEARRLVQGGGVRLNDVVAQDARDAVTLSDAFEGRLIVIKKGSKSYHLARLEG